MSDIDRILQDLPERIAYPPLPDVSGPVLAAISTRPAPLRPRRPIVASIAALALVAVVVILIPATRERVTGWLGIGGIGVETTRTNLDLPPDVTLGDPVGLNDVPAIAGFDPLLPEALEDPPIAFVDSGSRLWILWATSEALPPTAAANVGAVVTQFRTTASPGLTKGLQTGAATARIVDLDGRPAIWVEGPHDLYIPELAGLAVEGRSAGNTLIWEQGGLTIRLETALDLGRSIEIAQSFR